MKKCAKCKTEKSIDEFGKNKATKDGYTARCLVCKRLANARWDRKHKEERKEYRKKYYLRNKEELCKNNREYRFQRKEEIREYKKKYRLQHKEEIRDYQKQYRKENKDKISAYHRLRRKTDPAFRLRKNISRTISAVLTNKTKSTALSMPFSFEQLRTHLEAQFDEFMCWENYGSYWHIDHIYPQSRLPYESVDHPNFKKCWALENLRPLNALENIKKGNKIT